jgi:hypothetical protein
MFDAIAGPLAPLIFAMLAMAATWAIWVALAPARPKRAVVERLEGYVDRTVAPQPANRDGSLRQRVATYRSSAACCAFWAVSCRRATWTRWRSSSRWRATPAT